MQHELAVAIDALKTTKLCDLTLLFTFKDKNKLLIRIDRKR